MPIYEYECKKCGAREEYIIVGHEQPAVCTQGSPSDPCGGELERVISSCAFKFGGADGQSRTHEAIRKRNDDYHHSSRGQEEHRANVAAAKRRTGL